MIVDFRKLQKEHPLSTSMGQQWSRWKVLSSLAYTSLTNFNGSLTQTVWWRRGNSASSTSGSWRNLAYHLKPSKTFTDTQSRASCHSVSLLAKATVPPLAKATVPPATAGLSWLWCGLPNASPGAHYLPSRTPIAPDVTAFSPRYHPEVEVSTGASKLGLRGWKTASISRPSDC